MKRNLLRALEANTSPISDQEFNQFLIQRFGVTSKENASSDLSALNPQEKKFLRPKDKRGTFKQRKRA